MSDSWLAGADVEFGALHIPGLPSHHAADVHVSVDGLTPTRGEVTARLGWSDCLKWGDESRADRWRIGGWQSTRNGEFGVAVVVRGSCAEATADLRDPGSLLNRILTAGADHERVPLDARPRFVVVTNTERATFGALVDVLAGRSDLRERLSDPQRVALLAADLAPGAVGIPPTHTGVRRTTTEILTAMRLVGYEHSFGRPLPGDALPDSQEAINKVMQRIRDNPYAKGVEIEKDQVASLLDENYFDLAAWPFGGLTRP